MTDRKRSSPQQRLRPITLARWTARCKLEIVLRTFCGESLDSLSRETRQPGSRLAEWRDQVLAGGEEFIKSRDRDPACQAS